MYGTWTTFADVSPLQMFRFPLTTVSFYYTYLWSQIPTTKEPNSSYNPNSNYKRTQLLIKPKFQLQENPTAHKTQILTTREPNCSYNPNSNYMKT